MAKGNKSERREEGKKNKDRESSLEYHDLQEVEEEDQAIEADTNRKEDDELEDPTITETMLREEAKMEKRVRKSVKEEPAVNDLEAQVRVQRLKFLIDKSKIYTSILSEKLMAQQETARRRARQGSENSEVDDSAELQKQAKTNLRRKKEVRGVKDNCQLAASSSAIHTAVNARQPELVTGGVLRDYQLAGVEWMVSLYENGLNGILADEMGLGKTLQTISFLAFLRGKGVLGPFLIAAPLSTISNWVTESKRFAPSIPVVLYHGSKIEREELRRKHLKKVDERFPIVVTSFEIVMNDRKFLQKYHWKYIVVDEGHRLKNLNCRLIKELKSYNTANRLLLTGTPLQNNLSELWSLLNFLLPDIFSDLESFQNWFDFSVDKAIMEEETQNSVITNLHHILKPFLLRRLKNDVEKNLPQKREYLLYAPMTAKQTDMYKTILSKDVMQYLDEVNRTRNASEHTFASKKRKAAEEAKTALNSPRAKRTRRATNMKEMSDDEWWNAVEGDSLVLNKSAAAPIRSIPKSDNYSKHLKLRNMLMSLRKVCNHPYQMDWPVYDNTDEYVVDEEIVKCSGKMLLLKRLLLALFKDGHKVLIFSQFTSMLDIIQAWSEDVMDWITCRIDGEVAQDERREQIAEFNSNPEFKLFLLSTRAGGLGINLTAADTVILFDSDWNPQQDLQAMDRAHRIGQKRPVIVYRFLSVNTVESKILEKAGAKRRLEKAVIQKGRFKSLISSTSTDKKEGVFDLNEILLDNEVQKIQVKSYKDEIISDLELAKIMDRSDTAYEKTKAGIDDAGAIFKVIETKANDHLDAGGD